MLIPWRKIYEIPRELIKKQRLPRSIGAQYATRGKQRNSSRKSEEAEPK